MTERQDVAVSVPVPAAAQWLGALGALPFAFLAIASVLSEGSLRGQAAFALATYGAVILSFLGGIHWGLAIADFGSARSAGASYRRLIVSVVPSLVAWGALLLSSTLALLVLGAGFLAVLVSDLRSTRQSEAPAWYPKLRWPLTVAVVVCLVVGATA